MLRLFINSAALIIVLINVSSIRAQSFGFGCFGFVGGYAGYNYQEYTPGYLNDQINAFNTALSESSGANIPEFGKAAGYRLGINFFRADFSGFFFSLKGYYESLSEDHSFTYQNQESLVEGELELDLNSWNVGIDFGIPLTGSLNWKIIDGSLNFNSARLTHKPNLEDNTRDIKYRNDSPELGYSISSGFIFSIIKNFISLEGSVGYRFIKIKQMSSDEGAYFILRPEGVRAPETDFIKNGGFTAVIQLNVGFPL